MANIFLQRKHLCFFLEIFHLVSHQWTFKTYLNKEPNTKSQYSGSGSRYTLPKRSSEFMTYTSSCEVRKAKPHLQQVQQKSFYHYTSSGSYLWTSQRAADTIYSNFSKAFHTVFHDILVPKFGHDSLDRQTARWVKITGWMVQLRGQRSTP